MGKLLSANFARLWKAKVFWVCVGIMLLCSVCVALLSRQQFIDSINPRYSIDIYYFHYAVIIGLFCSLFCSMFFGSQYSDGTIRDRIADGHTRSSIYMANLIVAFVATMLIMSAWLIGGLVAVPTMGFWSMSTSHLIVYFLLSIMIVASFSSIFTFVCMLCSNKSMAIVVSILLFFGLFCLSSALNQNLNYIEKTHSFVIQANGSIMCEDEPNPLYVKGFARDIYAFIIDFLPTGQGLRIWLDEISRPVLMLVSSASISVLMTLGGIFAFKRKKIK